MSLDGEERPFDCTKWRWRRSKAFWRRTRKCSDSRRPMRCTQKVDRYEVQGSEAMVYELKGSGEIIAQDVLPP